MRCDIQQSTIKINLCKIFSAVFIIIVFVWVIQIGGKNENLHSSQTLKFVIAVTRHGVRTPLIGYPNDPYKLGKYWPDGYGALISVGKKQMYNVGTTLRQLYDGFLDPHYLSSEFRAYSTLIERTLQSAESLLAGLYPPKDYQQWNENIDWQPIPVFPNYLDKQSVPSHPQECTRYWKLQNDSQKLNEDNSDETKKIIKYVNDKSGLNMTSAKEIYFIWDSLSCEYYNGMKLPEWTKAVFPSPLESIWTKQIHGYLTRYEELVRLVAGPMMQSFIDSMKLKLNDTQNKERRMLYYSSHDHTLQTLLSVLGFVDAPLVKFAHTMLLELHSHPMLPSGHKVKFFQIDGTTYDRSPRLYNIPNCTTPCDFYQFVEVTKKYYDGLNWTKECQL